MTKENIKYIKEYLEWLRVNVNTREIDFETYANGMMNCNSILRQEEIDLELQDMQ